MCDNSVISIFVSKWEGQWDADYASKILNSSEDDLEILVEEEERRATPTQV